MSQTTSFLTLVHITCSIGIAPNRYLAKIASNMQKPDGLSIINPTELPSKLYPLNLKSLPGVGTKTRERLMKNAISSIEQLCLLDRSRLKTVWGNVWGEKVWYLIRGADLPLEKVQKSTIGQSKVLGVEEQEAHNARNILISLTQKAASRLRDKALFTTGVLLIVSFNSGRSVKENSRIKLSNDTSTLLKQVLKSWDKILGNVNTKNIKVKKISVSFYNLQSESNQLSFDNLCKQRKNQKISGVIDSINKRMGINMVSIGINTKTYKSEQIVAFGHIPKISN